MNTGPSAGIMAQVRWVSLALVVCGALNWGMVGLVGVDVIATLFGAGSPVTQALYGLLGAAGGFVIAEATRSSRRWTTAPGR